VFFLVHFQNKRNKNNYTMNISKIVAIVFICCTSHSAIAQQYTPSDGNSTIKFDIKNFGLNVNGSFKQLKGTIIFDPANLLTASFKVTVDAATVNTGNNSRDGHLKKEDYFDVAKYPMISFTSSKIEKTYLGYIATGKLTIKDKTKVEVITFTAVPQNGGYHFMGKMKLNRRDYGVGGSSMVLSDNLTLSLDVKTIQ
jgi:polyisoprenoid-binding protein YceI